MKWILSLLLVCTFAGGCNDQSSRIISKPPAALFDEKVACLLSEIAYCPNPSVALSSYMPGWTVSWEGVELNGNHAFVATDGKTTALAIRGSLMDFSWSAVQNWIYQDLNIVSFQRWSYTNDSSAAKIAEGAYDGWNNLRRMKDKKTGTTLDAFLQHTIHPQTPLLITGHSLGGNLATVYASYLWQTFKNKNEERKNINVISFAAPAAGNSQFATDFNKKFPSSSRVENSHDIVPKFPCTSGVASLGALYEGMPAAGDIMVGYKSLTVSLSRVFSMLKMAMQLLEFQNGVTYTQTNDAGTQITIPLSGKNTTNDIMSWLNEAGYQHGIAAYAVRLGVPVIDCEGKRNNQ